MSSMSREQLCEQSPKNIELRALTRPLSHVRQPILDGYCAAAALKMVLMYYRVGVQSVSQLYFAVRAVAQEAGIEPGTEGLSPRQIVAYTRSLGLEATHAPDGTIDFLEQTTSAKNDTPVIVIINVNDSGRHSVVVERVTSDRVYFHDPDTFLSWPRSMTHKKFLECWNATHNMHIVIKRPQKRK